MRSVANMNNGANGYATRGGVCLRVRKREIYTYIPKYTQTYFTHYCVHESGFGSGSGSGPKYSVGDDDNDDDDA